MSFPSARAGGVSLTLAVILSACTTGAEPTAPFEGEPLDEPLAVAYGWIGLYDGWGGITVGEGRSDVTGLVLRIALETNSTTGACPACLTVILDPWFSTGSLQISSGSEAFLAYEEQGVVRSLTIQRFSSGEQTANALIVKLRHETASSPGVPPQTLVDGDLEFRRR